MPSVAGQALSALSPRGDQLCLDTKLDKSQGWCIFVASVTRWRMAQPLGRHRTSPSQWLGSAWWCAVP